MHMGSRSPILDLTKAWLCLRLLPSFSVFYAYSCRNGQRTMRMRKSSRGDIHLPSLLPSRQHRAPESCVSDITTRVLPSLLQNFLSHFPTLPIFFYFLHAIRFVSTPATTFLPSDATRRCFPLKEQKNRENLHETKKKGNRLSHLSEEKVQPLAILIHFSPFFNAWCLLRWQKHPDCIRDKDERPAYGSIWYILASWD